MITGTAFPCRYLTTRGSCGMSASNSVHKDPRQYGYHKYMPPPSALREKEPSLYMRRLQNLYNRAQYTEDDIRVVVVELIETLIEEEG